MENLVIIISVFVLLVALFETLKFFPVSSTMSTTTVAMTVPGLAGTIVGSDIGQYVELSWMGPALLSLGLFVKYARFRTAAPLQKVKE